MIEIWVIFLLDNLFIIFGGPMGSGCSGGIVNLYLCSYELDFVEQLSAIYKSSSHPPELILLVLLIQQAFLLTSRYLDDISRQYQQPIF